MATLSQALGHQAPCPSCCAVLHLLDFISPNEGELVAMADAAQRAQQGGSSSSGLAPPQRQRRPRPEWGGGSAGGPASDGLPLEVAAALVPLQPPIAMLLRAGVGHIVLTLGPLGAVLCTLRPAGNAVLLQHMPALPAKVANCSGAGDCLVAGCLFGLARGRAPLAALGCGIAAARQAVQSAQNVPPELSAEAVEADAADVLRLVGRAEFAPASLAGSP